MQNYTSTLLCAALMFTLISCSQSGAVTDNERESKTESEFPEWYNTSGFAADSVYISTFATAISSDSIQSIVRAEKEARYNLESRIGEKLEFMRTQLEEKGATHARNADFILTLRNSHAPVEEKAELQQGVAKKNDTHYRGFAKVSISINELRNLLEAGFAGKASFWAELNEEPSFPSDLFNF